MLPSPLALIRLAASMTLGAPLAVFPRLSKAWPAKMGASQLSKSSPDFYSEGFMGRVVAR